jgi:hypothetical protein
METREGHAGASHRKVNADWNQISVKRGMRHWGQRRQRPRPRTGVSRDRSTSGAGGGRATPLPLLASAARGDKIGNITGTEGCRAVSGEDLGRSTRRRHAEGLWE